MNTNKVLISIAVSYLILGAISLICKIPSSIINGISFGTIFISLSQLFSVFIRYKQYRRINIADCFFEKKNASLVLADVIEAYAKKLKENDLPKCLKVIRIVEYLTFGLGVLILFVFPIINTSYFDSVKLSNSISMISVGILFLSLYVEEKSKNLEDSELQKEFNKLCLSLANNVV